MAVTKLQTNEVINLNSEVSKSFFCVFNNPEKYGYEGSPQEIVNKVIEEWVSENMDRRSCIVSYCVSADGLNHLHCVFEDLKAMRFSSIKKMFPKMNIQATKGSKKDVLAYIEKQGKFEEKGEVIIYSKGHGSINGAHNQKNNEFAIIESLLEQGCTPNEIMSYSFSYRKYSAIIRSAYFQKRSDETPMVRQVLVYWHNGPSGSGKSYSHVLLSERFGEDHVFFINEFNHGWDLYNGEEICFIDELKNQLSYAQLLSLTDSYKSQLKCRYANSKMLWSEVHISSIYTPEQVYNNMMVNDKNIDTFEQLKRRINFFVYHYKQGDKFLSIEIPMSEYNGYKTIEMLKKQSQHEDTSNNSYSEINGLNPFDL